jgi:hypothetical protein
MSNEENLSGVNTTPGLHSKGWLAYKYQTRVEETENDKHFSLLSYGNTDINILTVH